MNTATETKSALKQPKVAKTTADNKKRQPLQEGHTFKRSIVVQSDNKTVHTTYTFKPDEKSKNVYPVETVLDFSNCSQAEILELATQQIRIVLQSRFRSMGDAQRLDPTTYARVDVKSEIVETQRAVVDDDTRAVRALVAATGMSQEDAAKIVADGKKANAAKPK